MADRSSDDWQEDDFVIECAHCGERFFYELTRCPNCGRQVYEPQYEDLEEEIWGVDPDRDTLEDWIARITPAVAIFIGLFMSFVIASVIYLGLRFLFVDYVGTWPGRGLLLASVPAGAFGGAVVAAMMETSQPRRMGWWVGALSIVAAIVFASIDRPAGESIWTSVDGAPLWLVTLLSGATGGEAWRRRQRDALAGQLFGRNSDIILPEEDDLYRELYNRTGHDPDRVDRLIDFERQYMPNATRRTLLESALNRLERDNR